MRTNTSITVYHKEYDTETRTYKYKRVNYSKVWWFGGRGSSLDKGYDEANDVDIRISYKQNNINLRDLSIGDIVIKGNLDLTLTSQNDLVNYEVYKINTIKDNNFGSEPHVHLGVK